MNIKISVITCFIYWTFLFFVPVVYAEFFEKDLPQINNSSIKQYIKKTLTDKNIIYNIVPQGLVISVPTSEIFEDGHIDIKSEANDFLIKLGKIIKYIDKPCVVEGNVLTQKDSDDISNLELSIMRADRIVEFFIKKAGVLPKMIRGIGYGDMSPFDDNVSYKEHLNKRIDFVILNYEWSR